MHLVLVMQSCFLSNSFKQSIYGTLFYVPLSYNLCFYIRVNQTVTCLLIDLAWTKHIVEVPNSKYIRCSNSSLLECSPVSLTSRQCMDTVTLSFEAAAGALLLGLKKSSPRHWESIPNLFIAPLQIHVRCKTKAAGGAMRTLNFYIYYK